MTQKPFMFKSGRIFRFSEIRHVMYEPVMRTTGHVHLSGFGDSQVIEYTGEVDRKKLRVQTGYYHYTVDATHDGVREKIRRLRQQEAEALDLIDAQISLLRQEREDLIKKAWQAGNTVTVKELVERIK